ARPRVGGGCPGSPRLGSSGSTQGTNAWVSTGSSRVTTSPGSSGSAGGATSSGTRPSDASPIARFRASRPWLAAHGPKNHRTTVLTFRLKRKARILFTVVQVSPVCRTAGSFSVVGHRGINRVRFNGRLHGRRLPPGTYRIGARTGH